MATPVAKAILKTVLATGAFAVAHSLLASRPAKKAAAKVFGTRNADGWYRVGYIAQSVVTGGLLAQYLKQQPAVELYHVRGPAAAIMHAAQLAGLAHATAAARQVGILRITGAENIADWLRGDQVSPMPEAQGPGFTKQARDQAIGPFAFSRHPLNLSPVLILWLWPRMNSTLLAFNVSATVYLMIGSLHEEKRLLEEDGASYEAYQKSGVAFYWPNLARSPLKTIEEVCEQQH